MKHSLYALSLVAILTGTVALGMGLHAGVDQAVGHRVDHFAAGAGALITKGGDFDSHGVIFGNAQILPGIGGLVLAGEGGEKLGDSVLHRLGFRVVVIEEVGVFEVGDAGFRA